MNVGVCRVIVCDDANERRMKVYYSSEASIISKAQWF